MAEAFPRYNFLAKPLHDHGQLFDAHFLQALYDDPHLQSY